MARSDLPLLAEWLERPHVRPWYGERGSLDDVVAYYGPSIDGNEPTDHTIVELDGRPIGMLQTYVVADHPTYAALIGIRDRQTAGVDILLGEEELIGRGLGTKILQRFVTEVVFERAETTCCVADPDVENIASVRAFKNAAFVPIHEFVDPEDGRLHVLVGRARQGTQSAPR